MILIEKDKAIKETWEEPSYSDPLNVLTEIRDRLNALPTIEIVRCRECKWWELTPDNTMLPDWHRCRYYGARIHTRVEDFCSRAERRTDE